jgi:FixJ family two-component response regulator
MPVATGRVVVVDDEPHIRELLRDFLAGVGYEVMTFPSGILALKAVPTVQPDVILVDMLMPGLSGTDVLDALRTAGFTMPVILLSGTPQRASQGFFRQLVKPFNLRTVAEAVAAAMNHSKG